MDMHFNLRKNSKRGVSFFTWILSCLMFGLSFCACQDDGAESASLEEEDALQLGAGITGLTRATDAGFEVGDTLGLFAVKWKSEVEQDTLLAVGNYADNVWFRLESMDNNWAPERTIYFPNDDRLLDLYAYYPYRTPAFGAGTVIPVSVEANQSVGNCYTRSDFMVARTASVKRTREKVPLIFDHMLAQMKFVLKPGAGFTLDDLLAAKIKVVNAVIDGTYDLSDIVFPEVVTGTKRSDVIPAGSWNKGEGALTGKLAIVIPQELTPQTYIEVSLGNRRFTYKPSSVQLNPGCSREFTITVNNTGLDITTQINPWDNCPPVNGDADEEFEEVIVTMVTTKSDPSFIVGKKGDITVDWGDGTKEKNVFNHTYTDGISTHEIKFEGVRNSLLLLECSNNELTSLTVENNAALVNLSCFNNQLTSLNVNYNSALTNLSCSNNQLSTLDLSNNPLLASIDCYNNELTSLDVNRIALASLDCRDNQLITLDISSNTTLTKLSCSNNKLITLDVSKNTALSGLDCSDNQLTALDVSKNTALSSLNCSDNQLSVLDIHNNVELTDLNCSNNQLTVLDVSKNTALGTFNCFNNHFTTLDVSANTLLRGFNCSNNQLTALDVSKNTALTRLICADNQLTNLDVSNNTTLIMLDCSNNQLTTLDVSNNKKLHQLDYSGNPFITDPITPASLANSFLD